MTFSSEEWPKGKLQTVWIWNPGKFPSFCTGVLKMYEVYEAVQKGNPYQHGVQKYRNTSVYPVNITPLHTKNAPDQWNITPWWLQSGSLPRSGVPAHRFTVQHLSPLPRDIPQKRTTKFEVFIKPMKHSLEYGLVYNFSIEAKTME